MTTPAVYRDLGLVLLSPPSGSMVVCTILTGTFGSPCQRHGTTGSVLKAFPVVR